MLTVALAARRSVIAGQRAAVAVSAAAPSRLVHGLKDKEMAEERRYFNVEEERLLRQLASKMREANKATAAGVAKLDKEHAALNAIVGKYKISQADIDALIAWRHSHDF